MNMLKRSVATKIVLTTLAGTVLTVLVWTKFILAPGSPEVPAPKRTVGRAAPTSTGEDVVVELSDKQAAALQLGTVASREFVLLKTSVGTIGFNENMLVQVFSQYSGKIIKASFNIGDDVKQGDILFTIDSPDLLQAESTLLASAGVLELQKRNLARASNLLKSGGSAQKDVDQATSDEQTAEGNYKAARNVVLIFGKTDEEIDRILNTRMVDSTLLVPSPISGRIVARSAAPGLLTQPGGAPPPYQIADISTMWMVANVIETDAPSYKLGQEVEVRVPAYPTRVFKGKVTALGSTIDPSTHRQLVRSEIADPEYLLRSGMFASFVIRVGDPTRSVAVPATCVVREGDGTMTVWVTNEGRRFVKRTVKIGLQQDGWTQIMEGLQVGETVVTEGAIYLSNKLLLGDAG
ncbi:efflux RND transporter periplasmic adaptor subunit [Bradyrhizobium manausense]|uniref:efflux RND transporter periplasmic adaptor subunit n=2 Tax=Pseudomonadota TaxID=1224 RepID=UPI0020118456|nr:efflux RND transporter periplasmic adaptor subunit [Bradyrhizobium manausense]